LPQPVVILGEGRGSTSLLVAARAKTWMLGLRRA
jgi:hypothetical protein